MSLRVTLALLLCLTLSPLLVFSADERKAAEPPSADKDLLPKYVKMQHKAIPLSKALTELATQTGIEVEDMRAEKTERDLKLNLDKATFWQALDTIAREADLRVSLYQENRKIGLMDGPYREIPISYNGLFRVAVKRLDLVRTLEPEAHYCIAYLEVAWEPRFQGFLLENQPESLEVKDDKGRPRAAPPTNKGQIAVNGQIATEIKVLLPALPRSVSSIGLFKGTLSLVGSGKMLTFTFDKLDKYDPKKGVEQTREGVTVQLDRLSTKDPELWTIGFALKYPAGGPKFESFQSSLVNNRIYLEAKGKQFPANGGDEIDQNGTDAIVRYRFVEDREKGFVLGKIASWKVVYQTPGKIVEAMIPFEFKDVPLP